MPPTERSDGTDPEDDREPGTPDPEEFEDDTPEGEIADEDVDEDSLENPEDTDPSTDGEVTNQNAKLRSLESKLKEYESRIGSLAQANDERLKTQNAEWNTWGENYRKWAEEQIAEARRLGREEAEEKLLRQLDPESKSEYFEETRQSERTQRAEAEAARRQAMQNMQGVAAQIQENVRRAVAQGVPLEALDQSTPEAVIDSMAKYLRNPSSSSSDTPAEPGGDLRKELDDVKAELARVKRDASGASRTGTSAGGRPRTDTRLREIDDEIVKAKRMHNITRVLQLKRDREALLAGARR